MTTNTQHLTHRSHFEPATPSMWRQLPLVLLFSAIFATIITYGGYITASNGGGTMTTGFVIVAWSGLFVMALVAQIVWKVRGGEI